MTFDHQCVLVTGSGTGLGREIALQFAREGADLILHYSHADAGAKSAREQILAMGRRCEIVQADFNDLQKVLSLGQRALAAFGKIDVLVNNAGITFNKPFLEVVPEQFELLFHVNLKAQFFLTQMVTQHLIDRKSGGAICNISSIHGIDGAPEHALYAATKGAIIAYTRALAVEVAHKGIRVNAIAPGWVTVENFAKALPGFNEAAAQKEAYDKVPLGRSGKKEEIAQLATFLCSDAAGYIVGQTIVADGGTTSLMSLISNFRSRSDAKFGAGYVPGV